MIEDKIERLLHAMEHPDEYSDEELQRLMDDEEVRDCYELAVMARQGFQMRRQQNRKKTLSPVLKIAAMFVGVLLLTGIAFAAIRLVKESTPQSPVQSPITDTQSPTPNTPQDSTVLQTVVFENAELEQILSELSDHYHVSVEFRNEEVRHLRLYTKWEPTAPLTEMLERINRFEKVNITLKEQQMVVE